MSKKNKKTAASCAPIIACTKAELTSARKQWQGKRIALVPTMGALHAGHLSLVKLARKQVDRVVVSIFVNSAQFTPHEDFSTYPRAPQQDIKTLTQTGCDLIYMPREADIYPAGHATQIIVNGVTEGLESDHRPDFFSGVALIIVKLLHHIRPDVMVLGQKDYQQLAMIKRLVTDLDIATKIVSGKTIRDAQGLALSSRNEYLNEDGLAIACHLNTIMFFTARQLAEGKQIKRVLEMCTDSLYMAGFSTVDYVTVVTESDLEILHQGQVQVPARLLIAAYCKGVRLIDNCAVVPN